MMSLNKLRFFTPELREKSARRVTVDEINLHPDLTRWHRSTGRCTSAAASCCRATLLSSKGDRVAMHSSVETRYAFLDEDVIGYMSKLHPRWKLRP